MLSRFRWVCCLVWLVGCWAVARGELTLVYEVNGQKLAVVGAEGGAILVEREGARVKAPPGGTYQIIGDLMTNARVVRGTLNQGVHRREVPKVSPENRPLEGSVNIRHVMAVGPKKLSSQILEAWPVAGKQAGIMVAAWVLDGKVVKVAPGSVPAMDTDKPFRFQRRFALAEGEAGGKGVLLFWSNGSFVAPAGYFKEAGANRALEALLTDNMTGFAGALEELRDVNVRGPEDETLLHLAAANGSLEAVRLLVRRGARINSGAVHDIDPLAWAGTNGHLAVVKELLAAGAQVHRKNESGGTALLGAVENGHGEVALALLAAKADPNAKDDNHRTPLSVAIDGGYAGVVEAMSSQAGNRFWADDQLQRVLATQAHKGNAAMVKLLLEKGVKVDRDLGGFTALIGGAASGDPEIARMLIEAKCPVDVVAADGATALMEACRLGHGSYAEVLLKAGADPSKARRDGTTSLHLAVVRDAGELVSLLLANGAKPSMTNHAGHTPLVLALKAGAGKAARVLVDHGERLGAERSEQLMVAALQFDLVELIEPALAAPGWVEKPLAAGWTPMKIAVLFQAEKCVAALRAAGAVEESDPVVSVRLLDARPTLLQAVEPIDPRDVDDAYPAANVEVEMVVAPDGRVVFAMVRAASDPVLGLSAVIAVQQWRFGPITSGGKPAHVRVRTPVRFPSAAERVVDVANVDVAPQIIKAVAPEYPLSLRRSGEQGRIHVRFTVGVDGKVSDIRVAGASDPAFKQPVAKAVSQWTFHPGEMGGRPVATRMEQPVTFSLVH